MARIGLSKPYFAKYAANQGVVSYSSGGTLGEAVNVNITPDSSDPVKFFADNHLKETAQIFVSGALTLGLDHLSAEVAAAILGLNVESYPASGTATGSVVKHVGNAVAPYVGVGLVVKSQIDGSYEWMGIVLHKVQFKNPGLAQETQGETITFTAPSIEGTILRDDTSDEGWETDGYFTSEAAAEAWVKELLNIA